MIRIQSQYLILLSAVVGFGLLLSSCNEGEEQQSIQERQYTLSWSDDFEGEAGSLPDTDKWALDLGNGTDGWGNQELQSYTNAPENIALDGEGNLVITAIRNGNAYSSARIKTQGIFTQQYGRFEARLKTPYGKGIWPAFWLLGDNIETEGWPNCGEIDIMEMKGHQPSIVHGSVHGPGYSAGNSVTSLYGLDNNRFDNDFHVFAIEWHENQIDYFVDGYLYQRITPADVPGQWVFDHPFFIILNVAVGGGYVGFPEPNTPFPQHMIIDYVRVYQEN